MSISKPFTFTAGTKARANEVNTDFDILYSQVNTNISDIAQINRDVGELELNKAEVNGSSTQRFAVADAVSPADAVNKQSLTKSITNILDYISGLTIEKDTNSPNDTILVNPGSCYDNEKEIVLVLSDITSKQNLNQGANVTYYVYIIGSATGSSIDILISSSSVEPTLPTGYTKFRNIGSFKTNSSNNIDSIFNIGLNNSIPSSVSNVVSYNTSGSSGYMKFSSGLIIQWGRVGGMGNGNTVTVTLPTSFATTNYSVVGSTTYQQSAGDKRSTWSTDSYNVNNFMMVSHFEQYGGNTIFWTAIGV